MGVMSEQDRRRYETIFYCQKLEGGFLSGDAARALFIRSKLPLPDLTRIWKLSDLTHDNKLDVFEFTCAIYLIELKVCGYELPKFVDPSLYNIGNKNIAAITGLAKKENTRLEKLFERKDTNGTGYLDKEAVQPLMLTSALSPSTLCDIWHIADIDRDGKLSLAEFKIAFHLIKDCISGVFLDGPVNPFQCFPEKDNLIRSYKKKLEIFNKQYIGERKEHDIQESFFRIPISDPNNLDFDMLVQCLSPFVLSKVVESGVDDLSSKTTSKMLTSEIIKVEPLRKLEKVESRTVEQSSVDLESVFQSVDEETPDYELELSKPTQTRQLGIDDEQPQSISLVPKNPYIGKPLIFEDPVGHETICDVEFEVDFDSIIKDLDIEREQEEEKEMRKLPIARVQPIYKQPPIAAVEPIKKNYSFNGSLDPRISNNKKDKNELVDSEYSNFRPLETNPQDIDIGEQETKKTENQIKEQEEMKRNNMKNGWCSCLPANYGNSYYNNYNGSFSNDEQYKMDYTQNDICSRVDKKFVNSTLESSTEHEYRSDNSVKAAKLLGSLVVNNDIEENEREKMLLERINLLEKKRQELLQLKREEAEEETVARTDESIVAGTSKIITGEINDVWSPILDNNSIRKRVDEEERIRLSRIAEEKRKREADIKKRRDQDLLDAECRRKEQLAKEKEEQKAAKERREHFLQNLEKLKQRVFSEDAEKEKLIKKSDRSMASVVTAITKKEKNPKMETSEKKRMKTGIDQNDLIPICTHDSHDIENGLAAHKEDIVLPQNFDSTREKFALTQSDVVRRNKQVNTRPKSYYGGMFSKSLHQIIDDSPINTANNLEHHPDLVDEETLEQFRREQEFRREHNRMAHHRKSLDRATSYIVENVEKIWDVDTQQQHSEKNREAKDSSTKKMKGQDTENPNIRSSVDTITSEWNSFIDVLEENKKRQTAAVATRKYMSQQRNRHKKVVVDDKSKPKLVPSKSLASEEVGESDSDFLARQSGNVKNLVNAFKRLSVPCYEDATWKTPPFETGEDCHDKKVTKI